MNQKNPTPYSNYGYTTQQGGTPQYGQMPQSGQQPIYGTYPQQPMQQPTMQQPMQQPTMQQPMQQPIQQPMQTYMGGPLEASGGPLVPTSTSQFTPTSDKVTLGGNPAANVPGMLQIQYSYLENIIRLNKGNLATVHLTFSSHSQQPNMVVRGNIIASGRDHLILLDPESNTYYVLLMVYVDYITFNEPIQTS